MDFSSFNFSTQLNEGLDSMGFEKATPIQEMAIPIIQQGKDLIGCAQTGTGKTAAFLLPVIDKIFKNHTGEINTLIIVPTRELALQIDQAMQGFAYFLNIHSIPIYGGRDGISWEQEKRALTEGADVIIATPGRLISHLNMGYVKVNNVQHLILDEADRMLDMGFYEDLMKIVKALPEKRQTLMFSATMAPKIRELANKILNNPERIDIAIAKPAAGVAQSAYLVYDTQKPELIKTILANKAYQSVIVFTSRKISIRDIVKEIKKVTPNVMGISSDLEQDEREEVLRNFRNRKTQVLVATDVLSRGIDVENIELVVNYDVPGDAADYVHRVGRTARAETKGEAITFINQYDVEKFMDIEKLIEQVIDKTPLPAPMSSGPEYKITAASKPFNRKPGGSGGAKPHFRKGGNSGKSQHGRPKPQGK
ncbi:MAG: DEAD/DEAH box helicase [Bacteroidia bacterium]